MIRLARIFLYLSDNATAFSRAACEKLRAVEQKWGGLMLRDKIPLTADIEFTMHHSDEGNILSLRGCLNIDSSPVLRDRLLAMSRAQSPEPVIVDLTGVTYIDSSGIATLIEGLRLAQMRHETLCVQGLQGRPLHLFQVTGMSALFEQNGCGRASSRSKVS